MIRFHDDFHRKAREKQKRWYHKHKEKERGPFRSAKHGGYVLFSLGEKYVAISRSGAIVPWILAVWRWRHSLPANNEFGAWLRTLDAPPEHRVLLSAGGNLTYREMLAAHRVLTAGTGVERGYRPAVKIDPQGNVTAYRGERLAATAEGVFPNTIRHRQRRRRSIRKYLVVAPARNP